MALLAQFDEGTITTIEEGIGGNFVGKELADLLSGDGTAFGLYILIYFLAGGALLIYLIMGGIKLMTSGGDPKAISQGKQMITNALIGFFIIFAAFWIVQLFGSALGLGGGIFDA